MLLACCLAITKMINVRREKLEDIQAIREVNEQAFGQPQEANIVDKIRNNCEDILSMVAIVQNRIVGHILLVRL